MGRIIIRLLEFVAIVWLIRFLWKSVAGVFQVQSSRHSWPPEPFQGGGSMPPEPRVVTGEMKKDPQCGTYVSTELSIKDKYRGEELHFCSRRCQEEFFQAHSGKSA